MSIERVTRALNLLQNSCRDSEVREKVLLRQRCDLGEVYAEQRHRELLMAIESLRDAVEGNGP